MYNTTRANINTVNSTVRKRWQIGLQYPLSIVFWIFSPILWLIPVLFFGNAIVGGRYSESLLAATGTADIWVFTGLGLAYMNFMFSINWTTAYAIREEEFLGTLESIYVTPPRKAVLVLSHAVYALTYSGLSLLVQVIFVIYLMGGVPLVNILLAAGYIILAVFMVQGLSMILAAFVLTFKQGWRIVFTLQVAISLFTPAQFPLSTLPDWMYRIAIHSPFTTSTKGFREAILFGTGVSWLSDFAYMIIWGLALFYIGLRIYARQDRVLRSKGRLGKY